MITGRCLYCRQTVTQVSEAPTWSHGWMLDRPGDRFAPYLCEAREQIDDVPIHEVAGYNTVRIPKEMVERIRPYAAEDGMSIAEWVERAVVRRLRSTVTIETPDTAAPEQIAAEVEAHRIRQWRGLP